MMLGHRRGPSRLEPISPAKSLGVFERKARCLPNQGVSQRIVSEWCMSLKDESKSWSSVSLWAEGTLLEQDADVGALVPNKQRTVVLVNVLQRISSLFTRFEPVMKLVVQEMLSCIYVEARDPESDAPPVETWSNDDLYAQMTWFEKCQLLKAQIDKYKNAIRMEDENQMTIGAIKENLGSLTGFRCMLDPATRLLRQAIFNIWSGFAVNQRVMREKVMQRGFWKQDLNRKRLVFNAMVAHVRLMLKERITDMRKNLAKATFSNFERRHRRDAATALELLVRRVPKEPAALPTSSLSSLGGTHSSVIAVLNQAIRDLTSKEGDMLHQDPVVKARREEEVTRLFRLDNDELGVPAEEPRVVEAPPVVVTPTIDASTQYETPKISPIRCVMEDVPALAVDSALAHIAEIYDAALQDAHKSETANVATHLFKLHDVTRDFYIRMHNVRTYAHKVMQSLLKACSSPTAHPRLQLFNELWRKTNPENSSRADAAVYRLFCHTCAAIANRIPDTKPPKISACMNAKGSQISKGVVIAAIESVVDPNLAYDRNALDELKQLIVDEWSPTRAEDDEDDEHAPERETMNIDAALVLVVPWLERETAARRKKTQRPSAASSIQRLWRKYNDCNAYHRCQKHLWERIFDTVDAHLHAGAEARSNCFPYSDFRVLLSIARGIDIDDDAAMILFNAWHKKCDEMLFDECSEKKRLHELLDVSIAAVCIQRQWRAVVAFRHQTKVLKRTAAKNMSALKRVSMNKHELKLAADRAKRIRTIERMFVFKLVKRTPNDLQFAMELESARGSVAKTAFSWLMIRHGFQVSRQQVSTLQIPQSECTTHDPSCALN